MHVRFTSHKKRSSNKFMSEKFILFGDNFKIKNDGVYYPEDLAQILEGLYEERYENRGWKILNIMPTGSLGGIKIYWTYKKCRKEAKKYITQQQFKIGSPGAYNSARRNNWLDKICKHMEPSDKRPPGYWTKERCAKEVKKYKTLKALELGNATVYGIIGRKGWKDELCGHIEAQIKPTGFWNIKENCRKEAKKYKNKWAFQEGNRGAFFASKRNGWIEEICSHMESLHKSWDKESCRLESSKYKNRTEFNSKCSYGYKLALTNGWLKEFYPSK
ncbi:MAG: hypothetical protein ACHQYQ_10690 [Bacteriovoracales bacterium]